MNYYPIALSLVLATTVLSAPGTPVSASDEPSADYSIVNGFSVSEKEYPEVVRISVRTTTNKPTSCGGTIIDSSWVLTAAHCFDQRLPRSSVVVTTYNQDAASGVTREEKHLATSVFSHPDYARDMARQSGSRGQYDVALIRLPKPITGSLHTATLARAGAPIPRAGNGRVIGRGSHTWVPSPEVGGQGYYTSYPTRLFAADVPILESCGSDVQLCAQHPMLRRHIPLGTDTSELDGQRYRNPSSCYGDSGGPLYIEEYGKRLQVGIISHHRIAESDDRFFGGDVCGRATVWYTSIAYVRPWIDKVMASNLAPNQVPPSVPLPVPPYGSPEVPDHSTSQPPVATPSSPPASERPAKPSSPTKPSSQAKPSSPVQPSGRPVAARPTNPPSNLPITEQPPAVEPSAPPVPKPPVIPTPALPPVPKPQPTAPAPVPSPTVDQLGSARLQSHPGDGALLARIPKPQPRDKRQGATIWALDGAKPGDGSDIAIGAARLRAAQLGASAATKVAVLASEDRFADALASGPLQAVAPLYLTQSNALEPAVARELDRQGIREVWLLGGHAALAPAVEHSLKASGIRTRRIAGSNRIETAIAVSKVVAELGIQVSGRHYVALAFGDQRSETRAWADALALGALAAHRRTPILLTESDRLSTQVNAYVQPGDHAMVVGGHSAISDEVVTQLQARIGQPIARLAGSTRAQTAAVLVGQYAQPKQIVVIDGEHDHAWQTGFALAGLAGEMQAPIVLTLGNVVPEETKAVLAHTSAQDVFCVGRATVCRAVEALTTQTP